MRHVGLSHVVYALLDFTHQYKKGLFKLFCSLIDSISKRRLVDS